MTSNVPTADALRAAHAIEDYGFLWQAALPLIAWTVQKMLDKGELSEDLDLEELCQEGSLAVGVAIPAWRPADGEFSTYICHHVRWAILKLLRAESSSPRTAGVVSLDDDTTDIEETLTAALEWNGVSGPDVEGGVDRRASLARIQLHLPRLPERERNVLTLLYGLDGRDPVSREEAAGYLDLTVDQTRRDSQRGLARLRRLLTGSPHRG